MAKKKRRRTRSQRNRQQHPRPRTPATAASQAHAQEFVCPVPWVVLREPASPQELANDGSTTIAFDLLPEQACFAVFDAEGLLSECIKLVGPREPGDDERLLQMFRLRRHAVGDPLFRELPAQVPPPPSSGSSPAMHGERELRRYIYTHHPVAKDGSRTVKAVDDYDACWLFAVDAEGVRFDSLLLDIALGLNPGFRAEGQRFFAARRAAGDPMFAASRLNGDRS